MCTQAIILIVVLLYVGKMIEFGKGSMSKVFISYSHDSTEHSDRVLAFAQSLRNNGIDVELDQFHTHEIVDWPRWCNEQISRDHADFVLCVCTGEYNRRIEGKVPPEKGKGVYWEGSLIDDELYDEKGNRRFIPILFNDEPEDAIPRFLRGWTLCRLSNFALSDPGYEQVIRIITNQASIVKNPLGTIPVLPPKTLPTATQIHSVSHPQISPTRLRSTTDQLFGRDHELTDLDKAWDDPGMHVVVLVAWGGVGKTSLVANWTAQMAKHNYDGARYFDWTFYSQGTQEQGSASADQFFAKALEFFGDPNPTEGSPWDKGERLARLVAIQRTLLVLDGIEPLQYPPSSPDPIKGRFKDQAMEVLLKRLAQSNPGLCVVTTRESITDLAPFLDNTAKEWKLDRLDTPAGVALLKHLGVWGTDAEFEKLVEDVKGHALTLNLLGRFIAKAFHGDIRKRDMVRFQEADDEIQGGHAFRVMEAYEKWFVSEGPECRPLMAVLRVMGLFDRPADTGCIAALSAKPPIQGLTESLISLSEAQRNFTISSLMECGLISYTNNESLDAHPLVREYFAKQLREQKPRAWQAGHQRLFEHLTNNTKDKLQPTMEDLQPLYQAVVHGCQAGLHQKALYDVCQKRIWRGDEVYTVYKLGAISSDLGIIACFFDQQWHRPSALLSQQAQSFLLGCAAYCLRCQGRLSESAGPWRASLDIAITTDDWNTACRSSNNLSELELIQGNIVNAERYAVQSIAIAERGVKSGLKSMMDTELACVMHQMGRRAEAQAIFLEAEKLNADSQHPVLFSLSGFQYCDLLLEDAKRAAWQVLLNPQCSDQKADLFVNRLEAENRARKTLPFAEKNKWLLDIALDHLTLGRAAMYAAVLEPSIRHLTAAKTEINESVDGLRRSSVLEEIPCGLLSRAWVRFLEGDADGARADLDEAWEIAERGPMRLLMADILLCHARLFRDREALKQARVLIEQCGYWRLKEELEDAEAAAKGWP